ncbi:hypothetical protein [Xanthomonas translucens]|uniref:Uncharacterized protein n=1 Tax=Xanthomonas translucens pv. translucens TaxID=134875 RepID=A0ABW9KR98_XANCT|nr:hypothetical protein [Xanthomonas translucens]QSQ34683.1 hypothetical protein ISN31_03395 [Xanthomonas translucens pv. translucens]
MSTDARLSVGLPGHPKTKKLIRRLGASAGWSLVCLILWARANRADGDLTGMSAEDIELAADWGGENDALVRELASVGFLDGEEGVYRLHDWAEHQPWSAGSEARADRAKWSALCRRHGREEAARLMPEYAARLAKDADSPASSSPNPANSSDLAGDNPAKTEKPSAPSPSPSPIPSPSPRAEASSLRSDSSASLTLTPPSPPADLSHRKTQRIQQIAEEAQAAYNRLLAKPAGALVACTVLNKPRIKAVEKALPTARAICRQLYGNERVTPQFWTALFETAADDDFHSGKKPGGAGHENWKPDFEYLLRENVIAKLFDRAMTEHAA